VTARVTRASLLNSIHCASRGACGFTRRVDQDASWFLSEIQIYLKLELSMLACGLACCDCLILLKCYFACSH
jgi:hypothetical protein